MLSNTRKRNAPRHCSSVMLLELGNAISGISKTWSGGEVIWLIDELGGEGLAIPGAVACVGLGVVLVWRAFY